MRACEQCGKELERTQKRFCSRRCQGQWQSENWTGENSPRWNGGKVTRICEQCGATFEATPSRIEKGWARFCSRECKDSFHSENVVGVSHPLWKGKVSRICKQCGAEFEVWPSKVKQGRGNFCSKTCLTQWQSENLSGESSPHWKGGPIERICEQCREQFEVIPAVAGAGLGRFCSKACFIEWNIGPNNPQWRGGLSFEPYTPEFNDALKRQIRKRDGYRCAVCGKSARCVHHIDYDKTNNDPSNLITLGRCCHSKTNHHRTFWQIILAPIAKGAELRRNVLVST